MFEKARVKNYIRKELNNQFKIDYQFISALVYVDKFGKTITKPRNIYVGTIFGNNISIRYREFEAYTQLKAAYNLFRLLSEKNIQHKNVIVRTKEVVKSYKNNLDLAQRVLKTKLADIFVSSPNIENITIPNSGSFILNSHKQSISHKEYSLFLKQFDKMHFELNN